MKLALQTDYALRVLMYLGTEQRRCTIQEITEFFDISKDHLSKVVQRLARAGVIRSIRGVGGGLELLRSAQSISIGSIVELMEGSMHLLDCVSSDEVICVIQPGCRLRKVLDKAERVQMEYLNSVTLADVIRPKQKLVQLTK